MKEGLRQSKDALFVMWRKFGGSTYYMPTYAAFDLMDTLPSEYRPSSTRVQLIQDIRDEEQARMERVYKK